MLVHGFFKLDTSYQLSKRWWQSDISHETLAMAM